MDDDVLQLDGSTTHWGASEPALPGLDPAFMRRLLENISTILRTRRRRASSS